MLSQAGSALFVLTFLLKKADVHITFGGYERKIMTRVLTMGCTPFIIVAIDNVMIIAMNALLQKYGGAQGDTLITINTIVQSFMLVMTMPLGGISAGTQCILSYNFGARQTQRVRTAQKYILGLCFGYTALLFILARVAGPQFVSLFTSDPSLKHRPAAQSASAPCLQSRWVPSTRSWTALPAWDRSSGRLLCPPGASWFTL